MALRDSLNLSREPKEESLADNRYRLSHQLVNDRVPGEVRAEGDPIPILIEVFDGDELTYERVYSVHDGDELRHTLDGIREAVERGEYASKKKT